jgi:hypothetical protein
MKSLFILVSCFVLNTNVFSQISFIKTITNATEEIPICLKQIENSYFYSIRTCDSQLGLWQGARFFKLNSFGEITAEHNYDISDNEFFSIENILYLNNGELMAIGRCKKEFEENAQIVVMKMDTNLQINWEKRFAVNKPMIGKVISIPKENGNIIIGASCETIFPNWLRMILFMEISNDGDSIQSKYEINGDPSNTSIHTMLSINGQYKAFVYGYSSYVPNQGFAQILNLDAGFNLISVHPSPHFIEGYMTCVGINEFSYFLTGMAYSSSTHYDVGIAILSNSEDSIAYNHTGKPGTAIDYSGWQKCMSVANNNSIYTGGTSNDNGIFYNCYTTNKVMMLSNYDSLLNCRWTRFYGSDTACFTMSTLEATSDGGCIMGGMIYTPARPENLLDAVIIKADSLGLFTGISATNIVQVHEAIVYPNPGSETIYIHSGPQISGAEFRMYNVSGNQVLKTPLLSAIEQRDVSQFAAGTYIWSITYRGKVVEQGKWIKQ